MTTELKQRAGRRDAATPATDRTAVSPLRDSLTDPLTDPLSDPLLGGGHGNPVVLPTGAGTPADPGSPDPAPASPSDMNIQAQAGDGGGGLGGSGGPGEDRDLGGIQQVARQGVQGASAPLPHRTKMESYFGGPLNVSAHTDAKAQAASQALGAKAFTTGRDIAFGTSSPSPQLVAHELTHVAQQNKGVSLKDGLGRVGDRYERQADAVAAGVDSGRPASAILGGSFPTQTGGGSTAIQRTVTPSTSTTEQFVGHRSSGKTTTTTGHEDTTVTRERTHKLTVGAQVAAQKLLSVDGNTVLRAVQILALTGAFGERAGKVVLRTGAIKLTAQGGVKGRVGAQTRARTGVQTVQREIVIDGKVRTVIDSIKLLADWTAEVGAGGDISGKAMAELGPVGLTVAGKLAGFVGAATDLGGSVTLDKLNLGISASLKAAGKVGVEVSANGSMSVKFGNWVSINMAVGVSFFAGARGSAELYGGVSLRKFFTWSLKHQKQNTKNPDGTTTKHGWKDFEGDSSKETWGDQSKPKDTSHDINYGLDVGAKLEALAGAEGKVTGKVGAKIKNVGLMDLSADVTGLAGAKATGNARVAMSFHTILAEAKAEAFAGLKAQAKGSFAPISYKGRALIKVTGGASVYLGAGASAAFTFKFSKGKLTIGGKAAAALGFGFGFDVGLEIDITVILEALKDIVVKAIALIMRVKSDQRRARQGLRVGKYLAEDRPETPPDTSESDVLKKVRAAMAEPWADYESLKARSGRQSIKKSGIQKRVDEVASKSPGFDVVIPTKAGDRALKTVAMEIFGASGVLKNISFRAGLVDEFEIDPKVAARQKTIRKAARGRMSKYRTKKGRYGEHGVKGTQVKTILNKLIVDLLIKKSIRPSRDELIYELKTAAKEIFGKRVTLTLSSGNSPRVTAVDMHTQSDDEDEREEQTESIKNTAKQIVLGPFKKLNTKKLKNKKRGLWITNPEISKIIRTKKLSKMIDQGGDDRPTNLAICAGLQAAADAAFGLVGKIQFEVYHHSLRISQFPEYSEIKDETPAAYIRYLKEQVSTIITPAFTSYAAKKSSKGSHFIKLPKLQKPINKVNKFLDAKDEHNTAVVETVRTIALAQFGREYVFKLEVQGSAKKKLVLKGVEMADEMLQGRERYIEGIRSVRAKAKAAVLPRFTAYAQKKTNKGSNFVKKAGIQKIMDKAKVSKYLPLAKYNHLNPENDVPQELVNKYAKAIAEGLDSAALAAFGIQYRYKFGLSQDGQSVEIKSLTLVPIEGGTLSRDLTVEQRASLLDIGDRVKGAVQPAFEKYAAKGKRRRGWLKRTVLGHRNWINKDAIEKLAVKSGIKKFTEPSAPSDPSHPVNQAVIRGVSAASKAAFGEGRQTFQWSVLGGDIWLKRMQQVREGEEGQTRDATSETKALTKKAVGPLFEKYAEKKTAVKNWRHLLGVTYGTRSRHWVKQAQIQKRIAQADLGRYLDPLIPSSRSTLANVAVLKGVEEAAAAAFPTDYLTMTFELADPSVKIKTFELQEKALKLKIGSNLHYEFAKYRDSFKYRWHMKKNNYVKVKAALKGIIDRRIPSDYKTTTVWRGMVTEVGLFVYSDKWIHVKPI